ncbi:MAG: hypothetical protein LBU34_10720 [Planctomycetaceae bacterium]|nr:hypothetical protein [Planctomycetaceae bacterium]
MHISSLRDFGRLVIVCLSVSFAPPMVMHISSLRNFGRSVIVCLSVSYASLYLRLCTSRPFGTLAGR